MKKAKWLAEIDAVAAPEEWDEIRQRRPKTPFAGLASSPPIARRVGVIAVAFAITLSTAVLLLNAFGTKGGVVSGGAGPSTSSLSTSTSAANVPSEASVENGRFTEAVQLDNGLIRVDVAPSDLSPAISETQAADEIWANPNLGGIRSGRVLGFGLVTSNLSSSGVQPIEAEPAWIGFGWGGITNCPANLGSFDSSKLPSNGYVAVVVGLASDTSSPFSYSAETSRCGEPPSGPTVEPAKVVTSIP